MVIMNALYIMAMAAEFIIIAHITIQAVIMAARFITERTAITGAGNYTINKKSPVNPGLFLFKTDLTDWVSCSIPTISYLSIAA